MSPKGIPGWLAGYNAAIADAGDLIEREAGARCGMSEMVRALCKPTCARCGDKRRVRTAPAKDGASFMMPCPDCSKPETPPAILSAQRDSEAPPWREHSWTSVAFPNYSERSHYCTRCLVMWIDDHDEPRSCIVTPPNPEAAPAMTTVQIKHMVDRFLGWRLPESFRPDGGISFVATFNEGTAHPMKHEPSGTNLFDATQATAMVRYMLEGLPSHDPEAAPVCAMCCGIGRLPYGPTTDIVCRACGGTGRTKATR